MKKRYMVKNARVNTDRRKQHKVKVTYVTAKSEDYDKDILTKEDIIAKLPKVGQVLLRQPSYYRYYGEIPKNIPGKPCTVIAVYPETLCYLIEFETPRGNYREFRRFDQ